MAGIGRKGDLGSANGSPLFGGLLEAIGSGIGSPQVPLRFELAIALLQLCRLFEVFSGFWILLRQQLGDSEVKISIGKLRELARDLPNGRDRRGMIIFFIGLQSYGPLVEGWLLCSGWPAAGEQAGRNLDRRL